MNRRLCAFCRLAKCFANGMKTELIRCPTSKKTKHKKKMITTMPNDTLIRNDRHQQVTNLMNSYDEHSGLLLSERFLFQQNILPLKLRFKCGSVNDIFSSLFAKAQLLFEKKS